MQELYEKVAADSALEAKFAEIMKDAEAVGEEATKEKLIAFAKEAGYDITIEEIQEFFKRLAEAQQGELSEVELDQVAGGKGAGTAGAVMGSVTSVVLAVLTFGGMWATCFGPVVNGVMEEVLNN